MSSTKLELSSTQHPIWESSRRPLHPKCVWVESFGVSGASHTGHRHFIFDYNLSQSDRSRNDPPLSLNDSGKSSFSLEKMDSFESIESRMTSLSIIGSRDKMQNERAFSSMSDPPGMVEPLIDKTLEHNQHNDAEPIEIPSERTPSPNRISNEIDTSKNCLAERVLQWLDLAGSRGHTTIRRSEHIGKLLNASKRRSVTAKESRKFPSSQIEDESGQKVKIRREPVRQLSMTFNEDATKDSHQLNQSIVSLSFGDLFPVTYKCSRKFLSLRQSQNVTDRLEPLDLQSSLPLRSTTTGKKKTIGGKMKAKRFELFEDQYRSLIQRQILETTCNAQAAKRQLHIFMPNLPKRCLIVNETDKMSQLISPNSARDSDSCFSCRHAST